MEIILQIDFGIVLEIVWKYLVDIIFDLVPEIVLKTTSDLEIILQIISKSIMKIVVT